MCIHYLLLISLRVLLTFVKKIKGEYIKCENKKEYVKNKKQHNFTYVNKNISSFNSLINILIILYEFFNAESYINLIHAILILLA